MVTVFQLHALENWRRKGVKQNFVTIFKYREKLRITLKYLNFFLSLFLKWFLELKRPDFKFNIQNKIFIQEFLGILYIQQDAIFIML